jgi:integrase
MPRHHPTYRLHKPSGRAVIQWRPLFGKNPHYLPGKHNSPESLAAYAKLLGQITSTAKPKRKITTAPATLYGLAARFYDYAKERYQNGEATHIKSAIDVLTELHGEADPNHFGPLALVEVRAEMIRRTFARGRWSRDYINQQIGRIKRMFKWGVSREFVEPATFGALTVVSHLKRGECDAPDYDEVEGVDWCHVERVLPFVSPTVATMLRVQYLTGMRGGEVCGLSASELDRTRDVWIYRPSQHKTRHHGKKRFCAIGPQAQAILLPYLNLGGEFVFSPAVACRELGELRRLKGKPRKKPKPAVTSRRVGSGYNSRSYLHAVVYGLKKLARTLGAKGKPTDGEVPAWLASVGVTYFHPHQIRHQRSGETQDQYGIEGVRAQTGNSLQAAQIYAKQSESLAIRIARETG